MRPQRAESGVSNTRRDEVTSQENRVLKCVAWEVLHGEGMKDNMGQPIKRREKLSTVCHCGSGKYAGQMRLDLPKVDGRSQWCCGECSNDHRRCWDGLNVGTGGHRQ